MSQRAVVVLSFATLGTACVQYGSASYTQSTTVNASVQVSVGGPRLSRVPDVPSVPGTRVDAETIHSTLDGLGEWVDDPTYGVVWIPSREAIGEREFVPYGTSGHWVLTNVGWYWQSDYVWGWLTFHYGRWVTVGGAWAWVPGGMFAPAWVDWRVGEGIVGWAPLPPRGAPFTAPYVYCRVELLVEVNIWDLVVYGPAAASYYARTRSLPVSTGIGGALYSWGPAAPGARVVAIPVSTAWSSERAMPRAGVPASSSASPGASTPNSNVGGPRVGASASGGSGTVSARPVGEGGSPQSGRVQPSRTASMAPVDPAAPPPASQGERSSTLPRPDSVPIAPQPGTGSTRSERLPDTIVVRGGALAAPRIRETISLGTTEPSLPADAIPPVDMTDTAVASTPTAASGSAFTTALPVFTAPGYRPNGPPSRPPDGAPIMPGNVAPAYRATSALPSQQPIPPTGPVYRPQPVAPPVAPPLSFVPAPSPTPVGSMPMPARAPTTMPTNNTIPAPLPVYPAPAPVRGPRPPVGAGGVLGGNVFRR